VVAALGDVEAGHLLGRYELLLPIAEGGMGSVWAARLKGTRGFQKIVSIKTLLPTVSNDPRFEQMFLDEAALASRIRHPHVAEILDLGEQDGLLYLVMEWVDGEPLNLILRAAARQGGMPLAAAVRITSQVCRGLHAAHELRDDNGKPLGLVHRDVSPHNVLVSYEGVTKLVDFGVAKATSRLVETTGAGQIKGKIAYMAPEQLRCDEVDRRADIFATGILLYLLTLGRHPFKGGTSTETVRHIIGSRPARPRDLKGDYPRRLEQVVLKALAKDPADRFATADKMAQALDRALPAAGTSSDEEIAAFLRTLFSERLDRRRAAIQRALKLADARSGERPAHDAGTLEGHGWSPDKESHSSLRAVSIGDGTGPRPASAGGGSTAHGSQSDLVAVPAGPAAPRKRRRPALIGAAVLALGAAAAVGVIGSHALRDDSGSSASAARPAQPLPVPAPSAPAASAPAPAPARQHGVALSEAGAATAQSADAGAARAAKQRTAAKPKATQPHARPAPAKKKPRTTGLKDPYDDLGF
jgi:serine/threonine-protein kinase